MKVFSTASGILASEKWVLRGKHVKLRGEKEVSISLK